MRHSGQGQRSQATIPLCTINKEDGTADGIDTTCYFAGSESRKRRFLEPDSALRVVRYVTKTIEQLKNSEEFHDQKAVHAPLDLHHSQIEIGALLGQGTFSDVFEIKSSSVDSIDSSRHVVKVLRENMIRDPGLFAASAAGLASEAMILSLLDHQNIIRVKAWSHRGVDAFKSGKIDAFFIVLDRLDEMLSERIISWKHQMEKLRYLVRHRHMKLDLLLSQRIEVARDIAGALSYVHQRIVHRDIKPSNIGFQKGTIKLFDFDVSRILPKETLENQMFNLTPVTGTRRYMSPECGKGLPYNEKTDVYSFALLLTEIISLKKAFMGMSHREHEHRVFSQGVRPSIPFSCPKPIRLMIQHAWSQDMTIRPAMSTIHDILVEEVAKKLEHPSRSPPSRLRFRPFKMQTVFQPASQAIE